MPAAPLVTDPVRAHGVWIHLFAAVGAGALVGAARRDGVEPALLVGTGFAGAFLIAAALTVGPRRKGRQLLVGTALLALAPAGALGLGARPVFLSVGGAAALVGGAAVLSARRLGLLSRPAIALGLAAVLLAAPAAALAGGASARQGALLFGALWCFTTWRSLRVADQVGRTGRWEREALRVQGRREAAWMAAWTAVVVIVVRLL